jgi:MFS family permease
MVPINDNNRKWWILAAMGGVIGLILLDETVVGVALPTIRTDLGMSQVAAHWVVNAYLLVFAGLAAAAGRLGDLAGLHRLFTAGVAIFGIGSLACGFAESGDWLIAARAVQGVGAAVIFPCSLSMVTIAFPADQRGLALGLSGSIGTVFLALGPLIGGFFTDVVSWR